MTQSTITYFAAVVPTQRIRPFRQQPRTYFDESELAARAESMRVVGQQTAIIVERVEDDPEHDYELIDGESRWRSAKIAELPDMLVLVRSERFGSFEEKHLASLVANFNRSEHTPMEVSNALNVQMNRGMTQGELARAIGKDQMWVSHYLSLQRLHPEVQALLSPLLAERDRLPVSAAILLAACPREKQLATIEQARRADGRVTMPRIKEVLEGVEGVRRRRQGPAKQRVAVENALRAIGAASMRLSAVPIAEAREIFRRLKASGEIKDVDSVEELMAALGHDGEKNVGAMDQFPDLPCLYDGTEDEVGLVKLEKLFDYWEARIQPGQQPKRYLEIAYPSRGDALKGKKNNPFKDQWK